MSSVASYCVSRTDSGFGFRLRCFVDGKAKLPASIDNDGHYISLFFYNDMGLYRIRSEYLRYLTHKTCVKLKMSH